MKCLILSHHLTMTLCMLKWPPLVPLSTRVTWTIHLSRHTNKNAFDIDMKRDDSNLHIDRSICAVGWVAWFNHSRCPPFPVTPNVPSLAFNRSISSSPKTSHVKKCDDFLRSTKPVPDSHRFSIYFGRIQDWKPINSHGGNSPSLGVA